MTICPSDNSDFGREMKREGKEETVSNLITWLHQEASIRSRGKANTNTVERNEIRRDKSPKKTENNAANSEILTMKHVLLAVRPNITWLHVLSFRF